MKREQEIFPYIAHLLNGAEVEWKPLGEVAEIINGYAFKSGKYSDNGLRVIRISDVQKGKISDNNLKYYSIEYIDKLGKALLFKDDLVMSLTGNVGRVAVLNENHLPAGLNQRVACIRSKSNIVLNRFLFHLFDQDSFEQEAMQNATGGGQKNMSTIWLSKYIIPVPPLSVQQEIVRILDKFTQLEAELEAELDCRKRQYEYYRDKLLTSDENQVEWKTLGEVLLSVKTGLNPRRFFKLNTSDAKNYYITIRELRDGKIIPSDKTDRINDDALNLCQKRSNLEIGDVLFSGTGTIGEMAIIKEEPYNWNIKEGVYALKPNHIIITSGYIRYILSSQKIKDKIISKSAGGTVKSISMKELQLIQIPVPPIEEQERIAGILDKFDTLVNSISEGLPREIELRRKQYEYYREKLLSFPKN